MAELQERFRHWDERQGLLRVGHLPMSAARRAVVRSLATMHDGIQVFDAVVALLGDRGYIDPAGGETHRILHVRERSRPDWLIATPLLHLAFVPTSGVFGAWRSADPVLPEDAPEGWRPGDAPYRQGDLDPVVFRTGPTMRAGELTLAEGPARVTVVYDDRGLWKETRESNADPFILARYADTAPYTIDPRCRPPTPRPIGLLCRADLDPGGHPVDAFARMIGELDPPTHSAGRVRMPVPLPGNGVAGAWHRGLAGLRRALFDGRVPLDAGFAVADGFDGSAVASGANLDLALAAWNAEFFRTKPKPPRAVDSGRPSKPSAEQGPHIVNDDEGNAVGFSTGAIELQGVDYGAGISWPPATPKNIPAVMIELPPPSAVPRELAERGFQRLLRLAGDHGALSHAFLRDDPAGFTLIGEGIADLVDPETLDAELDAADIEAQARENAPPGVPAPESDASLRAHVVHYRCWDPGRQRRVPFASTGAIRTSDFDARCLNGDVARWGVTRIRLR